MENNYISFFKSILSEIGDGTAIEIDFLLDSIITIVIKNFDAEAASIFLQSEENKDYLVCRAEKGYDSTILGEGYSRGEKSFTSLVVKYQKAYNVLSPEHLRHIKRLNNIDTVEGKYDKKAWIKRKFKNLIAAPLKLREEVIGILKVENKRNDNNSFSEDEKSMLEITADLIALVVSYTNNQQKLQKATKLQEIQKMMPELAEAISENKVKPLLEKVLEKTIQLLQAEYAILFLEKLNKKGFLGCYVGVGVAKNLENADDVEYQLGKGDGLTGKIADGRIVSRNDFKNVDEMRSEGYALSKADKYLQQAGRKSFRNLIAVPLISYNKTVLGVLKVENKKPDNQNFTDDDEKMLQVIADFIAVVLTNTQFEKKEEESKKINKNREETEKDPISEIENLITYGKLEQAITATRTLCSESGTYREYKNEAYQYAFRYETLSEQIRKDTVSNKEIMEAMNKLAFDLLSFISTLKRHKK